MDQKTKQALQAAAARSETLGPYCAIGTVQGICESPTISAAEKIKRIRYLLSLLTDKERKED